MPNEYNKKLDNMLAYITGEVDSLGSDAIAKPYLLHVDEKLMGGEWEQKNIDFKPKPNTLAKMTVTSLYQSVNSEPIYTYKDFLLTTTQHPRSERAVVFPTFDKDILLSFGQKTKVFSYTGVLLDRRDGGNWLKNIEIMYNEHFRLEKLVKKGYIFNLYYSDIHKMGYITNFSTNQTADNELASFSFNMIVVNEQYIPMPIREEKKEVPK